MSTAALPRPYIQRNRAILWVGDVRDMLRSLPAESVQCVVTSPPYWGLRSYGTEPQVWGGEPNCEHEWLEEERRCQTGGDQTTSLKQISNKGSQIAKVAGIVGTCSRCGAWRGELGLEPTPELFVEHIVEVFREVRRVLRSDGTCWVNLGDSMASGKGTCYNPGGGSSSLGQDRKAAGAHPLDRGNKSTLAKSGLKPKDLVGIPWRVAFALQADGWWLRSDIIWHKPNPMPESVTDRPTKAHEYIFLLTKSARYFYDAEAVKEEAVKGSANAGARNYRTYAENGRAYEGQSEQDASTGRNKRTVWTIPEPMYRLRDDLTPEQRSYVLRRILGEGCQTSIGTEWSIVKWNSFCERAKYRQT